MRGLCQPATLASPVGLLRSRSLFSQVNTLFGSEHKFTPGGPVNQPNPHHLVAFAHFAFQTQLNTFPRTAHDSDLLPQQKIALSRRKPRRRVEHAFSKVNTIVN